MTNDYKLEFSHYEAVRLLFLLEMSVGVYADKMDEEEYQTEMAHFMSILEDYIERRRNLVSDANKDWW